jgi:hypothetical protein
MNKQSIVGSILIITSSEILALVIFILITNKLEHKYLAWIFSTMIMAAVLVYFWKVVTVFAAKQILMISTIVSSIFIVLFWIISFVWFRGLAKDISILSYYHVEMSIKMFMIFVIAHIVVLLIIKQIKVVYDKSKKNNSVVK